MESNNVIKEIAKQVYRNIKVTKSIQLPYHLCEKIIILCESTGKSFGKIVEEAVEEYVSKEAVKK